MEPPTSSSSSSSSSASSSYQAGSGLSQVSYLALNQLLTRGVTFLMNLYVARSVGPVAFGLQAVHLYLLNTIVLFLGREAGRKATIRYSASAPSSAFPSSYPRSRFETTQVVNLSWLSVAFAAVLTVALTAIFSYTAPAEALPLGYRPCLHLYAIATMSEMLCEPLYVIAARRLMVACRVWIDSAATLLRCLVTVVTIAQFDSGLMAFGYGQLAYSAAYSALFYCFFLANIARGDGAARVGLSSASHILPHPIPAELHRALSKQGRAAVQSSLLPQSASVWLSRWMDVGLFDLYGWLLVQMMEKLALTEGEKAVMVTFHFSLDQQGVYGLIQNLGQHTAPHTETRAHATQTAERLCSQSAHPLTSSAVSLCVHIVVVCLVGAGSLVARLLFAPLEEASATEFSLLFASIADVDGGDGDAGAKAVDQRQTSDPARVPLLSNRGASAAAASSPPSSSSTLRARTASAYSAAVVYLGLLLKLLLLVSLALLCFAPPFSFVFVDVLYGAKWSLTDAPRVLSWYSLYIGFMALNGLTEAFVTAVTSAAQMKLYNLLLLLFSALYLTACAVLLRFGAVGLIAANCFNMAMRIAYSATFITRFFSHAPHVDAEQRRTFPLRILRGATPAAAVVLTAAVSAVLCAASAYLLDVQTRGSAAKGGSAALLVYLPHIAVGVATAGVTAAALFNNEWPFLTLLFDTLTKHQRKAKVKQEQAEMQ